MHRCNAAFLRRIWCGPEGRKKHPEWKSCLLISARSNREEAEQNVSVGDMVGFDSDYQEFGAGLVRAKALDDRAGCYILIELIKKELPFDAYFVFTVMEEIGCLGAKTAAYSVQPQIALVIEALRPVISTRKKMKPRSAVSGPGRSFLSWIILRSTTGALPAGLRGGGGGPYSGADQRSGCRAAMRAAPFREPGADAAYWRYRCPAAISILR